MAQGFAALGRWHTAIEVGTYSPWVSRRLKSFGHEVLVAHARQVKLISKVAVRTIASAPKRWRAWPG